MSLTHHEVSPKQVAANQGNAQKSTGPKTAKGKARVALNAIKHGAYANADHCRRHVMLRRGEDPAQYEELHQDLVESWQPDDAMQALLSQGVGGQAMVMKTIGDKTWEKLRLQREGLEGQLASLELAQAQFQRRQLAARRWPLGADPGANPGFCGTQDSPGKFKQIFELLDRLQQWFEKETCPDEYPGVMGALYGDCPTVAGQQIRALFIQLFDEDPAVCEKARPGLRKWIAQEKSDVQQDRELYHRELALGGKVRQCRTRDRVAAEEAALERQINEQTRLLMQLKLKRPLWGSESEAGEASNGGTGVSPVNESLRAPESGVGGAAASGDQGVESPHGSDMEGSTGETPVPRRELSSQETIAKGDGRGSTEGVSAEKNGQNGGTKPLGDVESKT